MPHEDVAADATVVATVRLVAPIVLGIYERRGSENGGDVGEFPITLKYFGEELIEINTFEAKASQFNHFDRTYTKKSLRIV